MGSRGVRGFCVGAHVAECASCLAPWLLHTSLVRPLDHAQLYSLVYGRVEGEGRVPGKRQFIVRLRAANQRVAWWGLAPEAPARRAAGLSLMHDFRCRVCTIPLPCEQQVWSVQDISLRRC